MLTVKEMHVWVDLVCVLGLTLAWDAWGSSSTLGESATILSVVVCVLHRGNIVAGVRSLLVLAFQAVDDHVYVAPETPSVGRAVIT